MSRTMAMKMTTRMVLLKVRCTPKISKKRFTYYDGVVGLWNADFQNRTLDTPQILKTL